MPKPSVAARRTAGYGATAQPGRSPRIGEGRQSTPDAVIHWVTPSSNASTRCLSPDRILRYAAIIGRENVIAGTDCGLGGRVHADLAWAKLRTLVEGTRLASTSLWP